VGAGLHYEFDCALPPGRRVTVISVNGEELDDERYYLVATNSYLAFGGEGFSQFTEASDIVDTGIVDSDALENYFRQHSPVKPPQEASAINVTIVREVPDVE
jgi:5'-nucleotidase